ncbi:MarR family transcriptional regulator [Variovorax defluvii]|uniref:MarR family transcriptional regulator n=1 Tax=Variovorax defluvii TaxID=913761 RepID=A0ABP8HFR4_9BURK
MRSALSEARPWRDPLELLEEAGSLPVEMFLTFQVNQLSSAFERQWSRSMRDKAGVSLSEWRIMAILHAGPQTFARLVELTEVNKALVHRSAKALAELQLIEITDTPGDARSTTLGLTGKGQRLFGKIRPMALARQRFFLSALTAQERKMFYGSLQKLRAAAHEWEADPEG